MLPFKWYLHLFNLFLNMSPDPGQNFPSSISFVYFGLFPHTGSLWRHPYLHQLSSSMNMIVNCVCWMEEEEDTFEGIGSSMRMRYARWRRRMKILLKELDGLAKELSSSVRMTVNEVWMMRILLKESDGLAKGNRGQAIPTCGWGVGHGVPACQILSLCCVVWVMLGNYDFFSNYWGVGHWVPAYHILNLCSVFCKFCLAMVICFQIIGGWGTEYL